MPEGKQIDLLGETMAASWDHERSVTQVFALIASEQNDPYPLVKFELYPKNLCDRAFAFTFTSNALGESLFQLVHELIDSVMHPSVTHSFDFCKISFARAR